MNDQDRICSSHFVREISLGPTRRIGTEENVWPYLKELTCVVNVFYLISLILDREKESWSHIRMTFNHAL